VSFEITERTALASTDLAERFSADMRRLGCRLALDDFGTGWLVHRTSRNDVGQVEDRPKLRLRPARNPQDESVVRAIIAIAGEFALLTTAEGRRRRRNPKPVGRTGVDQLQGFLSGDLHRRREPTSQGSN
jgi:EAL domain-containing protein (putative c-di-GMP-specific phosphodiesterase class I)